MFFLLSVLQFLPAVMLYGQTIDHIKNLKDSLNIVSSAYKKIDLYNQISKAYIKINTDSFYAYHTKAKLLSEKKNYNKGLAESFYNRSALYFYLDSFQLSKYYYTRALRRYSGIKDTLNLRDNYYSLARTYYFLANYDSAKTCFQKSYELSKSLEDTSEMARSMKQIGKMFWVKGLLSDALKCYNISLPLAQAAKDTGLVCVLYNNIGVVYHNVGDYENALKYYYKTLPLRDVIHDYKGKSLTLNNIGMVFSEWEKHEKAYEYFLHAVTLSDSVDYLGGKAYSFYNIGLHYLNIDSIDIALYYFKQALSTYLDDNNDIIGMYICYNKLGKIYQEKNKIDSAFIFFKKALNVAEQMKGRNDIAGAYYSLGDLFLQKGEINKALEYTKKSNMILQKTDLKKMKHLNYELLSKIYAYKKQYKKALEYNILSNQYKDSIFNEEKNKAITKMEVLYRIEQKEQENEYLKKEQERQKAIMEVDKLTIRMQNIMVGVFSLLLILVIGFTYIFYREKQKLKVANSTKNKLFSIISHDLRGPLGNFKGLIDLILLDFANNDREKMNSLLQMMQKTAGLNYDLLENLLSWSRTESERLDFQPEKISLHTLVDAIFEHYDYIALTKSIQLVNKINEHLCIYADEYMINTILRNLISNALKFTNTNGKIIVDSKIKDEKVEISVEDNGVGMPPEVVEKIFVKEKFFTTMGTAKEKGTGLGLKLCHDFVKRHKGKINITSKLNKGTKISFTISQCSD